jgi:DNA-binding IclR family transcriptional regulator
MRDEAQADEGRPDTMTPETNAEPEVTRSGTQAIERAMLILRQIANRGHLGWQVKDLAKRCGLSKSTTHRLLTGLVRERMVVQLPGQRHYLPGPMLFELGLSVLPERGELQQNARTRLSVLARQTGGVGFLFFRSSDDLVCAVRVGTARMEARALAILPGTRKPLVVAAGGVAILLEMPPIEARLTIERNFLDLADYSEDEVRGMRRTLDRSLITRRASSLGDVLPNVNAFGVALRDRSGAPFASLALAGSSRKLPADRDEELHAMLRAIRDELESKR